MNTLLAARPCLSGSFPQRVTVGFKHACIFVPRCSLVRVSLTVLSTLPLFFPAERQRELESQVHDARAEADSAARDVAALQVSGFSLSSGFLV
jgi:hypothetical protein